MPSVSSIVTGSFGFVRTHVGVVAVWCVVYMVGGLLMSIVMRPYAETGMAMSPSGTPELPPGFLGYLIPVCAAMMLLLLVLFAAIFRAVLKPEEGRAAYLRLGGDELRLFGLVVILTVGAYLAMILVGVVLILGGGIILAMAGVKSVGAVIALAFPLVFLICVASIWLMVRLSPAGPLTLLHGKIIIGDAWRLTRGHFWTLFGGYLVVTLVVFAALLVFFGLTMSSYFTGIAHAMGDPVATQTVVQEEMKRMAPGSVRWFLMLIPGGVLYGVALALQGAMTAIATRDLLAQRDL